MSGVQVGATVPVPYRLSFLVGGLLSAEATIAIPLYRRLHDWTAVRSALAEDNLLHARTRATGVRLAREVVQRMSTLSDAELRYLETAFSPDRKHLLWAAAHRRALTECEDYECDVLYPLVTQGVDIDLDDGALVNYLRFGPALRKVASIEKKRTEATTWTWPTHSLTAEMP